MSRLVVFVLLPGCSCWCAPPEWVIDPPPVHEQIDVRTSTGGGDLDTFVRCEGTGALDDLCARPDITTAELDCGGVAFALGDFSTPRLLIYALFLNDSFIEEPGLETVRYSAYVDVEPIEVTGLRRNQRRRKTLSRWQDAEPVDGGQITSVRAAQPFSGVESLVGRGVFRWRSETVTASWRIREE